MQCEDSAFSKACKGFMCSTGLTCEIQAIIVANRLERTTEAYNRAHHHVAHGHQEPEK